MTKYVTMIGLVAILAVSSNSAAMMAAEERRGRDPRRQSGETAPGQNLDNTGAKKRGRLASACYYVTYEPWLFFSGGQGIRTLNRLPGT